MAELHGLEQALPITMDKTPSSRAKSSAISGHNLLSSPPRLPPSRDKERRNPSITPRKFRRFFTPRVSSQPSAARRALCDLTAPALNRYQTPSSPLKPISEELSPIGPSRLPDAHRGKRRKVHHQTPEKQTSHLPSPLHTSPLLPTPELRSAPRSAIRSLRSQQALQEDVYSDDGGSEEEDDGVSPEIASTYTRPVPLHSRGLGGQLVQRMTGAMRHASDRPLECPVSGRLCNDVLSSSILLTRC